MASTELDLKRLSTSRDDCIAFVKIARPEAANAFSAELMAELTAHFKALRSNSNLRAVILTGKGKHFSAGADLNWMKASAAMSESENAADANRLIDLFESLYAIPAPTIAVVRGAAYGGAVGLTACCDFAIAVKNARFCLSEVRLGLMPAVILPYLARKIPAGQLRRLGLSARVFSGEEAAQFGLVQRTCDEQDLNDIVKDELDQILQCSPEAQKRLKSLQHVLMLEGNPQSDKTAKAIAALRTSPSAQAGLKAFFDKTETPWQLKLPEDWTVND